MSLVSLRNLGRIFISIFPKFPKFPNLPIKNLYYELTAKATNNILRP